MCFILMRRLKTMLAAAVACIVLAASSTAQDVGRQTPADLRQGCWTAPAPQTLEEVGITIANQQRRQAQKSQPAPKTKSILALSSSSSHLKAAYAAGLLVGWGETGTRPDFSIVTAAGTSALFAPFAFLGERGDRRIADLFACESASFEAIAERAAASIDVRMLEEIASKHEQGARLLVALPGSAARPETAWDLGAIAASRHPQAHGFIRSILLASVDLTTSIDPAEIPIKAGAVLARNHTFRQLGAGEPFLLIGPAEAHSALYLIHNGVLYPDEGEAYTAARRKAGEAANSARISAVSAYDFFAFPRTSIRIASPRPRINIPQGPDFDMAGLRALFLDTYRRGRMSREWRRSFVDEDRTRY